MHEAVPEPETGLKTAHEVMPEPETVTKTMHEVEALGKREPPQKGWFYFFKHPCPPLFLAVLKQQCWGRVLRMAFWPFWN